MNGVLATGRGVVLRCLAGALLALSSPLAAQTAVPAWERVFVGPPDAFSQHVYAARQLADGSIMAIHRDGAGMAARRYDDEGSLLSQTTVFPPWLPFWSLTGFDIHFAAVEIDPFGRFVVSTVANETRSLAVMTRSDVWTMRYDGYTGKALWSAPAIFHGNLPVNEPLRVLIDLTGGVILAARTASPAGFPDVFGEAALIRYDGDSGEPSWPSAHSFPAYDMSPTAITVDSLGTVYLAVAGLTAPDRDVVVRKVDAVTGQILWGPNSIDFGSANTPDAIALDSSGGLIITASVEQTFRPGVVKLDAGSGGIVWGPILTTLGFGATPTGLALDAFGNPVISASSFEGGNPVVGLRVYKLSGTTGSLRWTSPALDATDESMFFGRPSSVAIGGNGDVFASMLTNFNTTDVKTWAIAGLTGQLLRPGELIAVSYGLEGKAPIAFVSSDGNLIRSTGGSLIANDGVTGEPEWGPTTAAGAAEGETVNANVASGPDGHPVVVGFETGVNFPGHLMIVKYDRATGGILWGPVLLGGVFGFEVPVEIDVDSSNDIVVAWQGTGLRKFDGSTGALLWMRRFPFVNDLRIAVDAARDVLVVATIGDFAVEMHKISGATAERIWGPVVVDKISWRGRDIAVDSQGDLVVAGDGPGIVVLKQKGSNGAFLWGPIILPAGSSGFQDPKLVIDGNDDIVVSGAGQSIVTAKLLGANGSLAWGPVVDPFLASTSDLVVDAAGRVAVSGPRSSLPVGSYGVLGYSGATGAPLWGPIDLGLGRGPLLALGSGGGLVVGATTPGAFDSDVTLHKFVLASGALTWGPVVAGGDGNQGLVGLDVRNDSIVLTGPDGRRARTLALTEGFGIVTLQRDVPPAYCGAVYDFSFEAANGTGLETWNVVSGSLPPGLTLSSAGQLSGTPTQEGVYSFRIAVGGVERDFSFVVAGALAADLIFALGGCVLELSVPTGWTSYLWLPGGETTPTIVVEPEATTTYGVLLADGSGCFHRASITLPGRTLVDPSCEAPSLIFMTPDSGPATGGELVTLVGQGFDAPEVYIGDGVVPSTFVSEQQLTATTPAMTPGSLNHVLVRNNDGASAAILRAFFADFLDVPAAHPLHEFVEATVRAQVTAGCGGGNYCPDLAVSRAEMAVFLLVSKNGPGYAPPPATGTVFGDVGASDFAAAFIEALAAAQVTAGCGGGNYCPNDPASREQMAVFLLRTLEGPTYTPPACTVPTFSDVPCSSPFAIWIEELVDRGVTAGCGGGLYCPLLAVSRGQMAVFLTVTFGLP